MLKTYNTQHIDYTKNNIYMFIDKYKVLFDLNSILYK